MPLISRHPVVGQQHGHPVAAQLELAQRLQRLGAGGGAHHPVALAVLPPQVAGDRAGDRRVVVDGEDDRPALARSRVAVRRQLRAEEPEVVGEAPPPVLAGLVRRHQRVPGRVRSGRWRACSATSRSSRRARRPGTSAGAPSGCRRAGSPRSRARRGLASGSTRPRWEQVSAIGPPLGPPRTRPIVCLGQVRRRCRGLVTSRHRAELIDMTAASASEQVDEAGVVELTRALVRVRSVNDPAGGSSEAAAAEVVRQQMQDWGWSPWVSEAAARPAQRRRGRSRAAAARADPDVRGPHRRRHRGRPAVDGRPVRRRDRRRPALGSGRGGHEGRAWRRCCSPRDALQLRRTRSRAAIVLAALVDEEGMMLGAKDFVRPRARPDGVDGVICCEPEGGEVCHVAKGALRLRVDFTGAMAHGAMPFQGRNPNRAVGRGRSARWPTLEAGLPGAPRRAPAPRPRRRSRRRCCAPGSPRQMNVMPAGRGGVGRRAHDPRLSTTPRCVAELIDGVAAGRAATVGIDVGDRRDRRPPGGRHRRGRRRWCVAAVATPTRPSTGDARAARRRAGRDRRHGPHLPGRDALRRLRARRQVDRPPGRRVRRGRRPRAAHAEVYVEAADRFLRRAYPVTRRGSTGPAQRPHRRRRRRASATTSAAAGAG